MSDKEGKVVGVTVITGFLGSGKTTLLSEILTSPLHGKRIAVIENEFGSPLGVKNEVGKGLDNACCVVEIFETTNGCVCCSGRNDFLQVLDALTHNKEKFDYVIVETTGLADPTFTQIFEQPEIKKHMYLDGIITMVDAKNVYKHLTNKPQAISDQSYLQVVNECVDQIAFADKIIINKIDLVNNSELNELEQKIKEINSSAEIMRTKFSKIDNLDSILGIRSYSLDRILKLDPGFLDFRPYRVHDRAISSLTIQSTTPLDLDTFTAWLKTLLHDKGGDMYRVKGVLNIKNQNKKYILQGVHEHFAITEHSAWDGPRESKLVFIGKNLNQPEIMKSCNEANSANFDFEDSYKPPEISDIVGRFVFFVVVLCICLYPDETLAFATNPMTILTALVALSAFVVYKKFVAPKKE